MSFLKERPGPPGYMKGTHKYVLAATASLTNSLKLETVTLGDYSASSYLHLSHSV